MYHRHLAIVKARPLFGVGLAALMGALLWPMYASRRGEEGTRSPCQVNLRQIATAMHMYAQDFDGRFPLVQGNGTAFGWADALLPYTKSTRIFQCPVQESVSPTGLPSSSGYTDYWLSRRLAGRPLDSISGMSQSILLGEGNDGTDSTNARYSYSSLPARWKTNPNSPLQRHSGTSNYAFADGHVKALRPSDIDNPRWSNGPTLK